LWWSGAVLVHAIVRSPHESVTSRDRDGRPQTLRDGSSSFSISVLCACSPLREVLVMSSRAGCTVWMLAAWEMVHPEAEIIDYAWFRLL
jgi:hypothetical protein